jgi:hypothetical protein
MWNTVLRDFDHQEVGRLIDMLTRLLDRLELADADAER